MRPCYQVKAVQTVEVLCWALSEEPAGPSRTHGPTLDVLRVRPNKISKGTLVRDLLDAINHPNLIQQFHIGRKPSMHTEN
mmetsp:Transcript_23111/g.34804  ORF Transcript_23111/g.34804 Transcript_23111/m.34804 type:complete len:80 (-) Transcript_23111:67-306(-)